MAGLVFWCVCGEGSDLYILLVCHLEGLPHFLLPVFLKSRQWKLQLFFSHRSVAIDSLNSLGCLLWRTVPSSAVLLVILCGETLCCGNGGNFIAFSSASGVKPLVSVNYSWESQCVRSRVKSVGVCAFAEMVFLSPCSTSSVLSWKCQ